MIVIVSPPAASETTADAFCLRARIPTTDMCSIEVHVDTILTVSRGAPRWSPNGWASGSELHPCAPSGLAGSSRRPTTSPRGFGTSALTNATSATTTPSKASLRDPRSTDPVGSVQQRRGLVVHQRGQDAGNCSAPVQTQVMNRVAAVDIRRLVVACFVVALCAACSIGGDGAEKASASRRAPSATSSRSDSGFGPCEKVKLEEFQRLFGDRFTVVKVGGTATDCTIVARDTAIGESLTIRDERGTGYGEDFAAARSAAEGDRVCPGSVHDVDGLGDRAFFVTTCASTALPRQSLHIEVGGSYLTYSAYFVPADRMASTQESLTALARRLTD